MKNIKIYLFMKKLIQLGGTSCKVSCKSIEENVATLSNGLL